MDNLLTIESNLKNYKLRSKIYLIAKQKIDLTNCMSLDFILIPTFIFIILFLLNRENLIYKKNQKVK